MHPKVVQGAAAFHHQLADPLLPQADPVLHKAAALDAAVDMLDPHRGWLRAWVATRCSRVSAYRKSR